MLKKLSFNKTFKQRLKSTSLQLVMEALFKKQITKYIPNQIKNYEFKLRLKAPALAKPIGR